MRKTSIVFWLSIGAFIIICSPYFVRSILWFLSGSSVGFLILGRWDLALFYMGVFSVFSLFLISNPLKGLEWKNSGNMYIAFFIALFAEMFGFPLTVYLLSLVIQNSSANYRPDVAFTFFFLGSRFDLIVPSLIAGIVSILALVMVILSWREIYHSNEELVTTGFYGFVRHPQYLGILSIITIWLFAWPTLPTFVMWPFLVNKYFKLSRQEEEELLKKYGEKYKEYRNNVPMLIP